jgi:hypothetical protein
MTVTLFVFLLVLLLCAIYALLKLVWNPLGAAKLLFGVK